MRTILLGLLLGGTVGTVPPATFTGTIIDAECVREGHAAMRMGPTDAECARACVLSHDSAFVLDAGREDPDDSGRVDHRGEVARVERGGNLKT
jgi:hypothetical protein